MAGMMAQRVPDISHGNPIDLLFIIIIDMVIFFKCFVISL